MYTSGYSTQFYRDIWLGIGYKEQNFGIVRKQMSYTKACFSLLVTG